MFYNIRSLLVTKTNEYIKNFIIKYSLFKSLFHYKGSIKYIYILINYQFD